MKNIIDKYNLEFREQYRYNEFSATNIYLYKNDTIILIDEFDFLNKENNFSYSVYCEMQNNYMFKFKKLYRFNYDENIYNNLDFFLNSNPNELVLNDKGGHFDKTHIDNTPLEHQFEEIFALTYGNKFLSALKKEVAISSTSKKVYFADYVLETKNNKYIFEENGVSYHHPLLIKEKKYNDQLHKQNIFTTFGYKTYRFSTENLNFKEQIAESLNLYLESSENFLLNNIFKNNRGITLYEHQERILEKLDKDRINNINTSLIILPTAAGKSEIILSDLEKDYIKTNVKKVLILVPTNSVKTDWENRLANFNYDITIDYYNNIFKIKNTLERSHFDYIVVDEAHHSQAANLKTTIQYFKPLYLLGLTATPERLDLKKIEEIFGEYEVDLNLEDAIKQNIVVDIAPFRLKSNIDLKDVRFNGKDYNYSDLEKTLIIDSRNQLIVDCILEYYLNKQGLIFCVNINHAKKIAKLLNNNGISSDAIYGGNKNNSKIFEDYKNKKINFLTTCNMVSEGWDCPQTEVIIMARPTLSKVIYYQQLGRGLRKYKNKECLWLVDVVDNYSSKLQPLSFNSLFKIDNYIPFEGLKKNYQDFLHIEGLNEIILKMEKIDIFNLEDELSDLLSIEQAARELYVGTNTLKKWDKESDLASKRIPIGNKLAPYFSNDDISNIRDIKKLKVHSELTIFDDFNEFIDTNDLTFSYKLVFMINCLKLANAQGEINLTSLVDNYRNFYMNRINENLIVDKKGCPYDLNYLNNYTSIKNNMLVNPFEKFERKRFMYLSKDLNIIVFNQYLWNNFSKEYNLKLLRKLEDFLTNYYNNLGDKI